MTELSAGSQTNYQKIYLNGSLSITLDGSLTFNNSNKVTHSLGYIPNFRVWYHETGDDELVPVFGQSFGPTVTSFPLARELTVRADETYLYFRAHNDPSGEIEAFYRIYLDAAES